MDPTTRPDQSQTPERGASFAQQLREEGRQRLDSTRRSAAAQVEGMADAVDAARMKLHESQPTLARYTASLADGIERMATRLRDASLEDLARDARGFASRNPGLFVLGSAAAGVILARFLKISTPQTEQVQSRYGASGSERGSKRTESALGDAQYVSASEGEPAVGTGTPPH